MIGRIYKITNLINGKNYIGQTKKTIQERFKRHIIASNEKRNKNILLYNAIKKYGIDKFIIELIEECKFDNLDEREIYWIKYYDTYNNGYNLTIGGKSRKSSDYFKIVEVYKKTLSINNTSKICKCCDNTVRQALKSNNIIIPKRLTGNAYKPVKIIQIDIETNLIIQKFNSLMEAVRWLINNNITKNKCAGSELTKCAKGTRKTAYGYIWKFY